MLETASGICGAPEAKRLSLWVPKHSSSLNRHQDGVSKRARPNIVHFTASMNGFSRLRRRYAFS